MKLESYAKIGIISAIVMFGVLSANFTVMILNHEFGFSFHDLNNFDGKQKQEILNEFYKLEEYKLFKERFPDSRSNIQDDDRRLELKLSQYEPSTENGLTLRISQHFTQDYAEIKAECDPGSRNFGFRTHASDGLAYDFIKTTSCLDPQ